MSHTDPRIGKIYMLSTEPIRAYSQQIVLLKILNIYYNSAYHANIFDGIDSHGKSHLDRVVFLTYLREATPEEILIYWPEDV